MRDKERQNNKNKRKDKGKPDSKIKNKKGPDRPQKTERPDQIKRSDRPERSDKSRRPDRSPNPDVGHSDRSADKQESNGPKPLKKPFAFNQGKFKPKTKKLEFNKQKTEPKPGIRLNKYIANSGVCSRREADEMIQAGVIEIDGKVVTEVGTRVLEGQVVKYAGEKLRIEKPVYVILNKPKDYITTMKDPEGRKTVMALMGGVGKERIFPVGRLDRNTTGILMFTNDGALAKKLSHPKHEFKKIYHVELDQNVKREHLDALIKGVELDDGFAKADAVEYANAANRKEIGLEIHSGRNRIVRRMFEHFDYKVKKLDRVYFAGLTKKDLPRGRWRHLTEMEVNMLKMMG